MSLISARTDLREIALKAQKVVLDDSLTQAEKQNFLDNLESDKTKALDEIKLHEHVQRFMSGAESTETKQAAAEQSHVKSMAVQVVESAAYRAMVAKSAKNGLVEVKVAATIDEGTAGTLVGAGGLAGALLPAQNLPGIVGLKFQTLTIADLMASGTTSAPAISYVIESAFQDLTATVAEKGAKPQLDLTLARRQDNVTKIANVAKVTDEMFADAPQFQSYLQDRMGFGVRRVEEAQLLNGNGTPPNLQGLLNRSGLATAVVTAAGLTAVKAVEGIFNQITALRATSFVEPDAIVVHPTDWQTMRLGKDANNQYFSGGPFLGSYGNGGYSNVGELWGLRVVVTSAIAQGTVLVGGFRESAQVFRREGLRIEMTDSNVDDFVNNLITIRAEERLALAVYRPAGFGKVTLTA